MKKYDSYSDEKLLDLMREDDGDAFTELYYRYWKLLFSVAANKLGHLQDAEEVVQEIFADFWNRRKEIVIRHSIKSFLAAAAKFQVYTILDKYYRRQKRFDTAKDHAVLLSPVEEEFDVKELKGQIALAALQLPERCRLVYELSRHGGLSNKEIAETLKISGKTVENQMTKALKYLRTSIESFLMFSILLYFYFLA